MFQIGTGRAFNRGEQYRTSTPDTSAWMAEFFRNVPAKKIANDAGINLRAAESIKQGRNGLTQAHLENLCNNNPDFRAAWFYRCGGRMNASPDQVAAIYRAINSVMRGEFSE